MNRISHILSLGFAGLLAGCVVTSVSPFYTEPDREFDPALLGKWRPADPKEADKGSVEFTRAGERAYLLSTTSTNGDKPTELTAVLFRLGDQRFLDLVPRKSSELEFIPVHQVVKVSRSAEVLKLTGLKYDWLAKLLEKDPAALRHEVIKEHNADGQETTRTVLTATTPELQVFLRRHVANAEAWDSPGELKR